MWNYWWHILDPDRSSDTVLYVQYSMWSFSVFLLLLYCLDKFITLEKIVRTDLIDFDVFMIDVGGTIVFPDFVCRTRRLVCLGFYDSVNIMLFFDQSILNHLYVL